MVIPLPNVTVTVAPTASTLSQRKWFYLLSGLMFAAAIVRMFIYSDLISSVVLLLVSLFGFYVLREDSVDMHALVSWGMVCFINGVVDTIMIVVRMTQIERRFYIWTICFTGPVAELLVAILVYRIYRTTVEEVKDVLRDAEVAIKKVQKGPDYGAANRNKSEV